MTRASWAIALTTALVLIDQTPAQGLLQSARDETRAPVSTPSSSGSSAPDDGSGELFGGLFMVGVLSPFYLPMALLEDKSSGALYFAPHPYAQRYYGYQIVSTTVASLDYLEDADDVARKSWAVRLGFDYGNDFYGLMRVGAQFKIEHVSRFGVTSNWNWYRERLSCGCIDETVIGDTNLTYRFAQNAVASMYAGLGFRMLTDRQQNDFGVNFVYGGDFFPVRPIVLSGVLDGGTLGNAGVFHARGSIGATWRGSELFVGYDYLHINRVSLQGPMAGVRFWF